MKDNKIKFFDIINKIDGLEYDKDPKDLRLHSEERFDWGAKTEKEYKKAEKEIDAIKYKGNGWRIYAWYDVSGYDYWMKNMREKNYIQITISFDKNTVNESEIEKIEKALDSAISDAYSIQEKYDYYPNDEDEDDEDEMSRGGRVQKNKWIQKALSGNKGALRKTAMRKGLLRNEDDTLSKTDLHKLQKMGGKTAKRAYLAETLGRFKDGGELDSKEQELKEKIESVLKKVVPNFYHRVWVYKDFFGDGKNLGIAIAASDYNINNVRGQMPQLVSLSLNLKTLELQPQVFGGNGGQAIYREPNMDDPKEKYLAMKSVRIPFRTPNKNEESVLKAIEKFAENYKKAIKENINVLKYRDIVDYNSLLGEYSKGGGVGKKAIIYFSDKKQITKSYDSAYKAFSDYENEGAVYVELFDSRGVLLSSYPKGAKVKAKMSNGGGVGDSVSEFEKKIKDLLKQENKWHFVSEEVDGKKVAMKFFVGKKEVYVQIFTIDNMAARMPRNYSGKRDTLQMIMDNFKKMSSGGSVEESYTLNSRIKFKTSGEDSYLKGNIGGDRLDLIDVEYLGDNTYDALIRSYDVRFEGLNKSELEDEIFNSMNEEFALNSLVEVDLISVDVVDEYSNGGGVKSDTKEELVSQEELDRFLDYVDGFYGKEGIYAKDFPNGGFTKKELQSAINNYIIDLSTQKEEPYKTWGGGDSLDRERVREYLEVKDYKHGGSLGHIHSGRYLDIDKTDNGNLKITINDEAREKIAQMREEDHCDDCIMSDLFDDIRGNSELMYFGDAGEMGFGLTSAPCITDGYYFNDDGHLTEEGHEDAELYYYEPYMVKSFIDEMIEKGHVIFHRAGKMKVGGKIGDVGNVILRKNLEEALNSGREISVDSLSLYLGRKPQYEENINGLNVRKCYLRPFYKLVK